MKQQDNNSSGKPLDEFTLSVGLKFTSPNFTMSAEICAIDKENNKTSVLLTATDGHTWVENDWNLQHTIWGFKKGEYLATPVSSNSVEEWKFEESANNLDVLLFNGTDAMPVFCSMEESLNYQYRNPQKRIAEAKLICEAVNSFQRLKDSNIELISALERIAECDSMPLDKSDAKGFVAIAKTALQKAKQTTITTIQTSK